VLTQEGEIIRRNHICSRDSFNGICDTLAFYYYYDKIAQPITNYLNNTIDPNTGNYLKDQIHYIVLCKGIPLKIKSADYGWVLYWQSYHISIDGLLCLLKTNNNNNPSIMKLYPPTTNIYYNCRVTNPYSGIDPNFNFNNRFKANNYVQNKTLNDGTTAQFKISCLVSRLDGRNEQEVYDLIDKSFLSDKTGQGTWILDGHYFYQWEEPNNYQGYNNYNQNTIVATATKLNQYGFNAYCDNTSRNPIYSYNSPVIGYLSWGRHSGYPMGFIVNKLNFNLMHGSVYNTIESYNGASMQSVYRVNEQSLLTEFIQIEGTSGAGHTYEPYLGPNNNPYCFFPAYAMGYNFVEAAYQGIQFFAWQNIVVGDPLTTIAWGKQSIVSDLNWSGTNLVTGEIEISAGKTLTIADSSTINLRHQGFITGEGELVIGQSVTFNIYSWQKGLFLSYDSDSPRLVWGMHPTLGTGANYKVYRKIGSLGNWDQIATTTNLQYTDTEMLIGDIGDLMPNLFYKVVAFSELPGTYESNTVSCVGNKNPKKEMANQNNVVLTEYSLEQNYPNPFNPSTQIKYSIKEAGLVQLRVYDILGKEVANLVNENKEGGYYSFDFDGKYHSSGVYIYQIKTPGFTQARKMILTK